MVRSTCGCSLEGKKNESRRGSGRITSLLPPLSPFHGLLQRANQYALLTYSNPIEFGGVETRTRNREKARNGKGRRKKNDDKGQTQRVGRKKNGLQIKNKCLLPFPSSHLKRLNGTYTCCPSLTCLFVCMTCHGICGVIK